MWIGNQYDLMLTPRPVGRGEGVGYIPSRHCRGMVEWVEGGGLWSQYPAYAMTREQVAFLISHKEVWIDG